MRRRGFLCAQPLPCCSVARDIFSPRAAVQEERGANGWKRERPVSAFLPLQFPTPLQGMMIVVYSSAVEYYPHWLAHFFSSSSHNLWGIPQ
ncbi:hypothetical protein J4Q44_G00022190 [Coregonus suidteri]|uniref:Uncharacterized protein n=1 Tax=Coregonus suidteri TaxID=861788 RepID=A0AAN8MB89_9TELE